MDGERDGESGDVQESTGSVNTEEESVSGESKEKESQEESIDSQRQEETGVNNAGQHTRTESKVEAGQSDQSGQTTTTGGSGAAEESGSGDTRGDGIKVTRVTPPSDATPSEPERPQPKPGARKSHGPKFKNHHRRRAAQAAN